jgi:DNA-directed RNA polymerase subunit RPC12/RpoP
MLVAERKETHHLAELEYSRRITFRRLVISKLNGQSEEFFLHPEKRDPDLPADADWDLAHVDNPFEEGHLAAIQENIRRVLLFDGDAGPGSKDVHRQYGPDFHCETCGGKGLQVLAKGTRLPLKKGAKPCEDCGATGNLDRAELGYPCSYCSVVSTCYPMSSLEIDARPHRYINRVEFGKSGLTFTEGPYRA